MFLRLSFIGGFFPMAEGELGCPERTYRYLQELRNLLIRAKIQHELSEEKAKEFEKLGWMEEALELHRIGRGWLKTIRELEDKIAELEKLCFGKIS